MKDILKHVVFILMSVFLFSLCIYSAVKIGEQEHNKYIKDIGKTVIIGKDTSVVVDYSCIYQNFKLSNGNTVSLEYLQKQNLLNER